MPIPSSGSIQEEDETEVESDDLDGEEVKEEEVKEEEAKVTNEKEIDLEIVEPVENDAKEDVEDPEKCSEFVDNVFKPVFSIS